jgi:magnesium chelatase family protein
MAIAAAYTRGQDGLSAPQVIAEVQVCGGLPGLLIVGLVETAIRESRERVRAAIREAGFEFPPSRVTVNLAPADLPKGGSGFDLAIAVAILAASRQLGVEPPTKYEFFGELAFSGALRPVRGLLPGLLAARAAGRRCIVPSACADEVALLPGPKPLLADHLLAVVRHLRGEAALPEGGAVAARTPSPPAEDLADIRGQQQARRALEIAAAGGHNLLMVGPPGTGKTLLARRLAGLLPPLGEEAALQTAMIHSLAGQVPAALDDSPPFRSPHHTASTAAIVGGGRVPRPGEISLAHNGVLFLDELPEFARPVLEALREPMENGMVTIARAGWRSEFPARFQVVAAMNPCPCGYAGDSRRACRCGPDQVARYQGRVSGPFLDRLDIIVPVRREALCSLAGTSAAGESSAAVRRRVSGALERQRARGGGRNSRLTGQGLWRVARLQPAAEAFLLNAGEKLALSARGCERALRVARTIADLAGSDRICREHLAEALSLRLSGLSGPA